MAEGAGADDVAALADAVQKSSRAQARLLLKLEDVDGKVEAGFEEMRQRQTKPMAAVVPRVDPILDAVDLLAEAEHAARERGDAALADGLAGIGRRLAEFIEDQGMSRRGAVGEIADARLFRIVGTEAAALPAGAITRVVRAAVVAGDKVVREGEAIVASVPRPMEGG